MKNLIYLTAILIGLVAPQFVMAQDVPAEKDNRKEVFQNHQAEVEAIKNDPNLSDSEKEVLVREKRMALKEEMGPRKGGRKGKGKGMHKGQAKKPYKKRRGDLQKKFESIDNDTSLSAEEKEAKKKALKKDVRDKWEEGNGKVKGKHKDKGNGKKYKKGKKAKKKFKSIENDPNLTEEEKDAKKKALKEKWKAKRGEKGGQLNSHGKGYDKQKHRGHHGSAAKKIEKRVSNRTLTSEQKEKANKRLDREERKLQKLLKKQKITETRYNERIEQISKVRANLNSSE